MKQKPKKTKQRTTLVHSGRDKKYRQGAVNIPPYRASTVIFESLAEFRGWDVREFRDFVYGRLGSPNSLALEDAYSELSGAYRSVATNSGMSAINIVASAFLNQGDHVLVTEGAYEPAGLFFTNHLAPFGVEVEFFSPIIGEEIAARLKPSTRVVYLEAPSTTTFEIHDIELLVRIVREKSSQMGTNITIVLDNTWAGPLFFRPLEHGIDVEVQAATKYIVGHSDAMLGIVACTKDSYKAVKASALFQGISAGPEECYLGLRGLRSMAVRMEQQFQNAMEIADWLNNHPTVKAVLYPPAPFSRYHDLWKKTFSGGGSLMGIILDKQYPEDALANLFDHMELFAMGYSWGGYESLLIPTKLQRFRVSDVEYYDNTLLRLHAGLEDVADLIEDLKKGLARLKSG
tara:strand:- start:316 stop:1521 length:1206 start_codon:yes stop_codon:yes gene_type:complete